MFIEVKCLETDRLFLVNADHISVVQSVEGGCEIFVETSDMDGDECYSITSSAPYDAVVAKLGGVRVE